MSNSTEKYALITGGSQGIGFATSRKMAARNYHVIIASRNQETSAAAITRIKADVPGARVEALPLDLASFASVRQFVDAYHAAGYPLHVLIDNAGGSVAGRQATLTADGFEKTFATNHLGHFLLTNLLLDDLKKQAPARVVVVTSQLHIPGYGGGPRPDFDWDNLKGERYYNSAVFYKNSKLANVWFTYELQRRLAGSSVTANAVCPGFVPESIAGRRTGLASFLYREVLARMPFARSLERASELFAWVATDPSLDGVGGKFFVDFKAIPSSDESYDEQKARKLWEMSYKWCGLR